MFYHKQSKLGTGWDSCAVILLVSPLGSLTIAKFNGVSTCMHCFVVAVALSAFSIYCSLIYILSVYYYCMGTIYVNVAILWKYNGNGRTW